MPRTLHGLWLGRRAYSSVHELQHRLHLGRRQGKVADTVLVVEHPTVITLGRSGKEAHLLAPRAALEARGIDVVETGRGGDVTLHAPGQLVVYPILDLSPDRRDVRRYVGDLTETMRQLAASWGIASGPVAGRVGLWVDGDAHHRWTGIDFATRPVKLGAIGVRLSRWVTMHGFAFNLTTDLDLFRLIVPCGIREHGVTSVQALTGKSPAVEQTALLAVETLARVLDGEVVAYRDASERPLCELSAEQLSWAAI